ncbi:SAC3/GANP/Nin1/mts3/eIF-3 p25 family-domain-containing protein [Xylaria arbuscula]|nr:SAC3/GANP/Nin1/mts3/eIF-3 p25 family-domain-containing protein [Xylaria arbuscula]
MDTGREAVVPVALVGGAPCTGTTTGSGTGTSRTGRSAGGSSDHRQQWAPVSGGSPRPSAKLQLFSCVSLSACLPCLARRRHRRRRASIIAPPLTNPIIPDNPLSLQTTSNPHPQGDSVAELQKEHTQITTTTTTLSTPVSSLAKSSSSPSSSPPSEFLPPPTPPPASAITMAERALQQIISQLKSHPNAPYNEASKLLSKGKIALLQLKVVSPSPSTPSSHLSLARELYEAGALFSIRAKNAEAFTRYVSQLQPFYELADDAEGSRGGNGEGNRNRVTGLYLLLLLTQGRYAEFHSELEALSTRARGNEEIERDRYLGYPIKLERWLMEGSYDRVWKAMKSREVPSEEYGVFSEILTSQIRSEIASSSERAYPSLPLSSTKSLLFLDSEGAVVDFARHRGWIIRDGQIFFPAAEGAEDGADDKELSQMVIENTLGYARELETIV